MDACATAASIFVRLPGASHGSTPIDLAFSCQRAPEPRNVILMALSGLPALLVHLRARYSHGPAWRNVGSAIEAVRRELKKAGQS